MSLTKQYSLMDSVMPVTQHIIKRTIHWLTQGLPVSHWQAAGLPKRQNNISHIFFTLRVLQCKPSGILSSPYSHPIAHLCAIIGHGAMPVDPSHSTESLSDSSAWARARYRCIEFSSFGYSRSLWSSSSPVSQGLLCKSSPTDFIADLFSDSNVFYAIKWYCQGGLDC